MPRTWLRELHQGLVDIVRFLFARYHKGDAQKVFTSHQQRRADRRDGQLLDGGDERVQDPCLLLQHRIDKDQMRGGQVQRPVGRRTRARWVAIHKVHILHLFQHQHRGTQKVKKSLFTSITKLSSTAKHNILTLGVRMNSILSTIIGSANKHNNNNNSK